MAFYIDLNKIEHTETYVRYRYYNRSDNAGIIELNFITEKFKEIEAAPDDPNGYMFERTAIKITKHWKKVNFLKRHAGHRNISCKSLDRI